MPPYPPHATTVPAAALREHGRTGQDEQSKDREEHANRTSFHEMTPWTAETKPSIPEPSRPARLLLKIQGLEHFSEQVKPENMRLHLCHPTHPNSIPRCHGFTATGGLRQLFPCFNSRQDLP